MKITTLIEDTKRDEKVANEFGLSLFIEFNGTNLLIDTGSTGSFVQNGKILGKNLKTVSHAVITHAHADHTGGLDAFLKYNDTAKIFMHKDASNGYYGNIGAKLPLFINSVFHPLIKRSMAFSKYIGLDPNTLNRYKERIRPISKFEEIYENVFIITDMVDSFPKPEGNKYLLALENGTLVEDRFKHEIILVTEENDGVVIFSGCCHTGILNIIETVKRLFNGKTIKAVIGGLHMKLQPEKDKMAGTQKDIEFIASEIIRHGIQRVYTGHCTGREAYAHLKNKLKERITPLYTGSVIDL